MPLKDISIQEFAYTLPEERIARYPLEERSASRLLVLEDGQITPDFFGQIGNHLPADTLLVFNNTRVIKARLKFRRPTGAEIEVFCLQHVGCGETENSEVWECFVGNVKKWKDAFLETRFLSVDGSAVLRARLLDRLEETFRVEFRWEGAGTFLDILELAGQIPIPPYLHRNAEESDTVRYQTVYAAEPGSVAAPTAGLHFTEEVMNELRLKGIETAHVTLHVGAGTFKPVVHDDPRQHHMHEERVQIPLETLQALRKALEAGKPVCAVGTTSMRTLESLYWAGVRAKTGKLSGGSFTIDQWEPYGDVPDIPATESLRALEDHLFHIGQNSLSGTTRIMIVPGYRFRLCRLLITNFHQPQSTLLLLVAAFVGDDWKKAYDFALANGYRFLSYGDSNLYFGKVFV